MVAIPTLFVLRAHSSSEVGTAQPVARVPMAGVHVGQLAAQVVIPQHKVRWVKRKRPITMAARAVAAAVQLALRVAQQVVGHRGASMVLRAVLRQAVWAAAVVGVPRVGQSVAQVATAKTMVVLRMRIVVLAVVVQGVMGAHHG